MKKSNLYQTANNDKEHILRILRATYASQILSEIKQLQGFVDKDMIECVIENVHTRLPNISWECDVSLLVTDCVRNAVGLESIHSKNIEPGKSGKKCLNEIGERIGRRHRRIMKYAIPISCVLILIALLLLYFFPHF